MTLRLNTIGSTGPGERLLVLVHGYGADENDLAPLAPLLDPHGRFFAVAPRAPIDLFPYGAGWYERDANRNIDLDAFVASVDLLDATIDAACESNGFDRHAAVIIGFSQGAAMTLASSLRTDGARRPAAIACLSGMLHRFEGLDYSFDEAPGHVVVHHGSLDPVVDVERGRAVRDAFDEHGVAHEYREYAMGHEINGESVVDLRDWLDRV